ncbi:hypothetical protein [Glycomyces arizonensis]|uniref:hypothetical protein n=1 Tax=Glycomyces arizonensis TaxID=256035 RepID=UPI0012EBC074|nr:hypothetical protein [Glycomyces arizonensis]
MASPTPENLVYPDPPRPRVPVSVNFLLLLLTSLALPAAPIYLAVALRYQLEWGPWATGWGVLGGTIVLATLMCTMVAWSQEPKGGRQVEFPLPLIVRVLLRVLLWIGVLGLVLMAAAWLQGVGVPETAVIVGAALVSAVAIIGGGLLVVRWCAPVGGTRAMYDLRRPRGSVDRDPLTPEQIAKATGRPVSEVVRLDTLHPKVRAMRRHVGYARARFVLDDGSHVEVALLLLFGQPSGNTNAERLESRVFGTTPEERLQVVRKDHRLEAVPETGQESYACIPLTGGTEWLWTRLAEGAVLEIRTSPRFDRRTRARLAQTAAEWFDLEERMGLDG